MAYAKERLSVDGVLAHAVGDFVPDENVERNGWEDSVQDTNPLVEEEEAQAPAPKQPQVTPPAEAKK